MKLGLVWEVFKEYAEATAIIVFFVLSPLWGLIVGITLIALSPFIIGFWIARMFYDAYKEKCLEREIFEFFRDFDVMEAGR
jgi:hypothetical protein